MDLNIPTTLSNNQENNQLLLNAIKNKFAAQSENEIASFSPPKFNIPLLKIPGNAATLTTTTNNSKSSSTNQQSSTPAAAATQLNQFLLKQLQDKHSNENGVVKTNSEFILPQLQLGKNSPTKFELPKLTSNTTPANISTLTNAIQKLQVDESFTTSLPINSIPLGTSSAIDLTFALSSKSSHHQGTPPSRDFNTKQIQLQKGEQFVIPFIECDQGQDNSRNTVILATANEYCTTDISQLSLQPNNLDPSAIGRLLDFDNKFVAPPPLNCFSSEYKQQQVKHTITPFQFDTKSPDDIVLETLNKFHRRYFN